MSLIFDYTYKAGPKKQVVLMGTQAFNNLLTSIQSHIHTLNFEVGILEEQVMALTTSSEGHGRQTRQAADSLVKAQDKLRKTRTAIEELKKFFVKIKRDWKKPQPGSLDMLSGHLPSVSPPLLTAIRKMFVSSSLTRTSSLRISRGTCLT